MANAAQLSREKRWIVLATDGRHVTLGRHSDPTEAEITAAEHGLAEQGLAGWLAVVEGSYWARRTNVSVLMVRALAQPSVGFEDAVNAFKAGRDLAIGSV